MKRAVGIEKGLIYKTLEVHAGFHTVQYLESSPNPFKLYIHTPAV